MRERERERNRGGLALSNEILHTIRFSSGTEIPLLEGTAHVSLVAPLYHGQTDCC